MRLVRNPGVPVLSVRAYVCACGVDVGADDGGDDDGADDGGEDGDADHDVF